MEVNKMIEGIPESSGVYLMRDAQGHVVYVGKAINIRKRVLSHFRNPDNEKDCALTSITAKVEFFVTPTEIEALLLENNLIKKHKPRYNIRLRDDKTYPFVKLSTSDKFPQVTITRRIVDDGSMYFGPMGDVGGARTTLKMARRLFQIRNCAIEINGKGKKRRPCLEYQLKQCSAPCAGLIGEEEYRTLVDGFKKLMNGEQEGLTVELRKRMDEASRNQEFEKAAFFRDRIGDLERTTLKQVMVFPTKVSKDVIALSKRGDDACVQLLTIRSGKLVEQSYYLLEGVGGGSDKEIYSAFINQHYYHEAPSSIPPEIMLPETLDDKDLLEASLTDGRKRMSEETSLEPVKLATPASNYDLKLLEMAKQNADAHLTQSLAQEEQRKIRVDRALAELKVRLKLPELPRRLEVFDVSNISGEAAVGSMVSFHDGEPDKSMYRRFKIKTVEGQNDFAMMKEIVKRRYKRLVEEKGEKATPRPDLILVDGGKGQLNAALEAEKELGITMPTIALAKEFEDVYVPYQPNPVDIPKDSKAMLLLKRARDEAHRFAVSYHRKKMRKESISSVLQSIPGVGAKRRLVLLQRYRSIDGIVKATDDELSKILRISREAVRKMKDRISKGG